MKHRAVAAALPWLALSGAHAAGSLWNLLTVVSPAAGDMVVAAGRLTVPAR